MNGYSREIRHAQPNPSTRQQPAGNNELQLLFDSSPRVVAQGKLADALNGVVQRITLSEDDIGSDFIIPSRRYGDVRGTLIELTEGGRGTFQMPNGTKVSVHSDNVKRIDDRSKVDDELMDEEDVREKEEELTEENITFESARKLLETSSPYAPLPKEKLTLIRQFFDKHIRELGRKGSSQFGELLAAAEDDFRSYDELTSRKRKIPKQSRRKKKEKASVRTFGGKDDESEVSSEESDMDERFKKFGTVMAPISGRSHVPGVEDARKELRSLSSGLPYRDTYLLLLKEGSMVPRMINDQPNVEGHRKKMRDVRKNVQSSLENRDELLQTLEKTKEEINSKKFTGGQLLELLDLEETTLEKIKLELSSKVRPHIEGMLFGSSLKPTGEDFKATEGIDTERGEIKKRLIKEPTSSGTLTQAPYEPGVSGPSDTESHSEQALLATRTWMNLVNALVKAIASSKDKPEEIEKKSFTSLQLALNRSTCIGCARELTAELVRFWSLVAKVTGLSDWREAKFIYEDYVDFTVSFPAIYENDKEAKIEYRNFNRIILGLIDAGWNVHITTGIEGSEESGESNEEAKKRVKALASIPQFFVKGWSQDIVRFPIPGALQKAVKEHGEVVINGILYTADNDSLTYDPETKKDSVSQQALAKLTFARTGSSSESGGEEEKERERKKGGLAEKYSLYDELLGMKYDETLQQMLLGGWKIQNVPGTGMNCLIRAIFTAAGINYDETMVAIVRRFLVDLGVAQNGDMLDLLDVQGDSLIHFLQAQGVLGANTGITVHFPGNSMQVVNGANQLQLWFDHAHFQAVVPKK